jgi:hypothetical protein
MPYPSAREPSLIARGHPQGEWPMAVFYPFEHPTPYAYGRGYSGDSEERQAKALHIVRPKSGYPRLADWLVGFY